MNNTFLEKILGTILLIVGLSTIGGSLYLGINVFVKAETPPEIFKPVNIEKIPITATEKNPSTSIPKNLNEINQNDIQKMLNGNAISPEMIKSIIPPEMFNYVPRMLNLSVFSLFLWVVIGAGAKVASLGTALIKSNSDIKL